MSIRTRKIIASAGLQDNSVMGIQNSVGPCAWIFFPFNESIGATSLVDLGADALAKTVTATTGTQGKPATNDAAGAPDSGTVPQGITASQSVIMFGLWDTSGAGTDYAFCNASVGSATAGLTLANGGSSYGDGAANALGTPTFNDVQVDGFGLVMAINADDVSGDTIAQQYAYDPTSGLYLSSAAVTDANRQTINPTNSLGWNVAAKPTYGWGVMVFDGDLPSTWEADIAEMFDRWVADPLDKRLPSNLVTLGAAAA